ncbi:MAG: LPS export ABC transporter permease LptF [Pseudomonadota bacterium]
MPRLDRYIIRLIIGPFLFFVLVFTGVIWLSQSLRVIDTVVNAGQSATVFLEFTALLLPQVMSVVLPVAIFAATLFAMNRLFTDSEVVVMFASGRSSLSLLRPVAVVSIGVMLLVLFITAWMMPTAQRELRDRITEIRGDIAAAFLREGAFIHPARGLTVYIREMGRPGEMLGIFVHDVRNPEQVATYTAERAILLQDEIGTRLVMFDGVAQISDGFAEPVMSLLRFDQFSYDLSQFAESGGGRARKPSELFLPRLLTITAAEAGDLRRALGEFRAEAHEALSAPLYVLALPMLAVAFVVSAGFRRQGFAGRVIAAAVTALLLRLLGLAAKSATTSAAALWPTLYLPPLLAIALSLMMLSGIRASFWRKA